jgi:hypothetical protein
MIHLDHLAYLWFVTSHHPRGLCIRQLFRQYYVIAAALLLRQSGTVGTRGAPLGSLPFGRSVHPGGVTSGTTLAARGTVLLTIGQLSALQPQRAMY